MRLNQLDRILEISEDRLTGTKGLSLSEEYLKDHFPRFPVMPGVLMVEAMFQASMFLVRYKEDFAHSMVVLRESKNIKFGDFVEPGRQLQVEVKIKKEEDNQVTLQVKSTTDGQTAVRGQMILEKYNLVDRGLAPIEVDNYCRHKFKKQFYLLCGPNFRATGKLSGDVAQVS